MYVVLAWIIKALAVVGDGGNGLYCVLPFRLIGVELVEQFALSLNMKAEIMPKPQSDFDFLDPRPLKSYLDSTKFIKATDVRFTSMREVFQQFATELDFPSKS